MNSTAKEYSVFLSYAHQDSLWVAEFANALRAAGIHDYWFDLDAITPGDNWAERIQDALRQSETLIAFLSPNSTANPNVLFELGAAVGSQKTIIPVLIGNVDLGKLPGSLDRWQFLRAESPTEAGKQVAEMIQKNSNSGN